MPYDAKLHAPVLISKAHRDMLKLLAKKQKRSMKDTLELLIETNV